MNTHNKPAILSSLKKLAGLLRPYRLGLFVCAAASIVSIIFTVIAPAVFAKAIDLILSGSLKSVTNSGNIDFPALAKLLLFCLVIYFVSAAASSLQAWLLTGISNKIGQNLRCQINEKINRLPMDYFDKHRSGDTLSLLMNDVNAVTMGLNQGLPQIFAGTLTVFGILTIMLMTDWIMTLVALSVLPLSAFLLPLITTKSQAGFRQLQDNIGQINGVTEEVLGGHFIVKSCNREEKTIADFEQMNQKLGSAARTSLFYSSLIMPLMLFAMNCGYVLLCVAGGFCAVWGRITVGGIQAFIQYSNLLTQPLGQLAGIAGALQQMFAAVERITVLMEETEESPDPAAEQEMESAVAEAEGEVRFENVRFGYLPEQTIIHNFSLTVKAGQKVAIVGPTGAGKTTLVKLLMRFYELNAGTITVDGHNIRDYSRHQLRRRFGIVLQDTWLYSDTIRENIRYGCRGATNEEVLTAAKYAHTDNFIRTLPSGYDLILSEGADNISQGQKQLLTIARALLPNPKILILDEATSAVDTHTEVQILRAMNNLMRGRTSFVIAHRLSTIQEADVILAMKDGDIVETGNHKELLAKNGFYAKLYNSQFTG